jgi:hypothetical protein
MPRDKLSRFSCPRLPGAVGSIAAPLTQTQRSAVGRARRDGRLALVFSRSVRVSTLDKTGSSAGGQNVALLPSAVPEVHTGAAPHRPRTWFDRPPEPLN